MWTGDYYTGSDPLYRCQYCAFGTAHEAYTNATLKEFHLYFITVGNIFKCPDKLCDRQNVSFEEFYSKSCCKNIIETSSLDYNDSDIVDHDFLHKISTSHKKAGILKRNAQANFEDAKKKMKVAEKNLKETEEKFQKIEGTMAHYFSRTLESITQGKPLEEDSRLFCKICHEKYNDDDRVHCVLHCRHSSCEKCLNALSDKTCPVCRNPFTDDQIIKLCN